MFYATHILHLPQREPLKLHVVEVKGGVVVSLFPFDGERQSMVWIDELYASHNAAARFVSDIKNEAMRDAEPLYLFSVADIVGDDVLLSPIK